MRPQFEAALRLFARASTGCKRRGASEPVLVGGAVVELYSDSAIATGDFDVATVEQEAFEAELRALGFVKPSGAGQWTRGWVHPDLALGFEVVASDLLDGNADRARLRRIDLGEDGTAAFLSVEDMIADRMGQHASGSAPRMLEQARALYALHPDVDRDYLEDRIRLESAGDHGVSNLTE